MKKRKKLVLTAMLIALTIVFSFTMPFTYASTSSITQLQQDQTAKQKALDALNSQLAKINKDKKAQQNQKAINTQKKQIIQDQINNLANQISVLDANIAAGDASISAAQADFDKNMALYKERMRASYMLGSASYTELILGASDFYDFLAKYQIVQSITKHDNDLLAQIKKDKEDKEAANLLVKQSRAQLATAKSQSDAKKTEYTNLINVAESTIDSLTSDAATKQKLITQYQKDLDAINAKIMEASGQSTGTYVGGTFLWPVPGSTYISCGYGPRTNPYTGQKNSFHTGIDIAGGGILGRSIFAANSGTVKLSHSTAEGVYGKYILVDHGGGFMTFYGHCNSVAVSVGQAVTKGQVIGTVGSTGNSTGPHLHFEIHVNGATVNPMNYFTKK